MSQLNKVFQYVVKLFNYKTYVEGKGYFTANLINVYERYYDKYSNASEVKKMDIWTDILAKWWNSYQNRYIKNLYRKLEGKPVFKCPEMYKDAYNDFLGRFNYTIKVRIGKSSPVDLHKETNFYTLMYLHDDYKGFISYLNYTLQGSHQKIKYEEAHYNPQTYSWYESKEIIPGHYSDITKLHHHNHQYYRFHPAILDLN